MDDLTRTWTKTQTRLPEGWALDGLRCASIGLRPADRSDDWIAVALNAAGDERRHRAVDPIAALLGLAEQFESDFGRR